MYYNNTNKKIYGLSDPKTDYVQEQWMKFSCTNVQKSSYVSEVRKWNGAESHIVLQTRLGISHNFTEFGLKFMLNCFIKTKYLKFFKSESI